MASTVCKLCLQGNATLKRDDSLKLFYRECDHCGSDYYGMDESIEEAVTVYCRGMVRDVTLSDCITVDPLKFASHMEYLIETFQTMWYVSNLVYFDDDVERMQFQLEFC